MRGFYSRAQIAQIAEQVLGAPIEGQTDQDIYEASTVQKLEIGARRVLSGKTFHYGYISSAVAPNMAVCKKNPQDVSQEAIGANADAGAMSIVLKLDNTDGPTYNGLLPADYFRNGHVVVFPAAGAEYTFTRVITGNTAVTVNASVATFTVTLDKPTPCAITTSGVAEVTASIYKDMCVAGSAKLANNSPFVGVPAIRTAAGGFYIWVQTWGIVWVSPHANVGKADGDQGVWFNGDGSFGQGEELANSGKALNVVGQWAGFVTSHDKAGGQGAPFVMLMLDP